MLIGCVPWRLFLELAKSTMATQSLLLQPPGLSPIAGRKLLRVDPVLGALLISDDRRSAQVFCFGVATVLLHTVVAVLSNTTVVASTYAIMARHLVSVTMSP